MLEKLRKTLSKEFTRGYERMESNYLGLENRINATLETRISTIESKLEELAELLKESMRHRLERNEDKMDEIDAHDDGVLLSESIDEVKGALEADLNEVKESVNQRVEKISKTAQKAKETLVGTVNDKLRKGKKVKHDVEDKAHELADEAKDKAEEAKEYLDKKVKKSKKKAKKKAKNVVEEVKETAESIVHAVADKAKHLVEDAKNLVTKQGEKVKDAVEDTEDYVEATTKKAKKKAKKTVAEAKKAAKKAKKKAKAAIDELDGKASKKKAAKKTKKEKDLEAQAARLKEAFADHSTHQEDDNEGADDIDDLVHDYDVALDDVEHTAKQARKESQAKGNDDLTLLVGLGEKMSEKLVQEGITSFQQLATLNKGQVAELDAKIKSFSARYDRNNWKKQAKDRVVK